MDEGVRQGLREAGGLVRAGVVHDDPVIHDLRRHDLLVRPARRLGGVARGQDRDDFLIFEHGRDLQFTIYDLRLSGQAGLCGSNHKSPMVNTEL
jgi:hypothetical protein